MKPSNPLLLSYGTLLCKMYPEGKVAISWRLVTTGFPQCNHPVIKLSADTGSLCSADLLTSSHPKMSASHLLGLQGLQQIPAQ